VTAVSDAPLKAGPRPPGMDGTSASAGAPFRKKSKKTVGQAGAKPPPRKAGWPDMMLFILSLIYLIAEIEFNMSLLDVAGSVRSDPAEIESLQVFGRSVSGCGCFLLVLGFFARTGFHVTGKLRTIFMGVAALSFLPMLLILLQGILGSQSGGILLAVNPEPGDMLLAMLPLLGLWYGLLMGSHKNAFVTIASLFLMVWPAIFLGQKLLIEQSLIERTTWEQRVNARYVLMLRAVLEDCTINLTDLELCDAEKEQDSVKSARIILGSIWMLSPDGIRQDMNENREKMVNSVAARGIWFPPKKMYEEYKNKVQEERDKFEQEFLKKVYEPYRAASDMFATAMSQEALRVESEKVAKEIDKELEIGWRQYQAGVRQYQQSLSASAMELASRLLPYKRWLADKCRRVKCPAGVNLNDDPVLARAKSEAEREFVTASGGYPPNLRTKEEFVAAFPTQLQLRNRIEAHVHEKLNAPTFMLPANWTYDRHSFQAAVENLMMQEVRRKWQKQFGDKLPPGLSVDKFLEATGTPPLPPMSALLMTPEKFFQTVILPQYRKMLDKMLGDIEGEQKLYANGEELAEKGKDYARAVYIPAISLIISLTVVILTMFRWWVVLVRKFLVQLMRRKILPLALRPVAQFALTGVFAAGVLVIPHFMPNPYTEGGYKRYLSEARALAPVTATVLDWAIHAQPAVYRLGAPVRIVLDKMHETGKSR